MFISSCQNIKYVFKAGMNSDIPLEMAAIFISVAIYSEPWSKTGV